jgi:ATP-dependent Lon protease
VVRKDLTKLIKEGANVPVYVLEYLLGMYCASDDEETIRAGLVDGQERILAENYVRPDEAEKVKSKIRERGVQGDRQGHRQAQREPRRLRGAAVQPGHQERRGSRLLRAAVREAAGGRHLVHRDAELPVRGEPAHVALRGADLKPIQMPNMDMEELFEGRKGFTEEQWIDALLRSTGMEPTCFKERVKWHLLARMIPLVENNYNLCELGPRGTGKSHIYKEISPNSILVSGGQTTVANLFYNMSARKVGLVGLWDVVAFDEVAGINFKDQDGVQIMKDYMASGSFSRGRESINASAAMVFVGNLPQGQTVETLVKTSHLFAPFPDVMIDSAFFDRFHAYVPGWEIPKMRPEFFTDQYGLIVDYLAEWAREMRKRSFADAIDKYFKLGNNLNQRDTIAVRRTVSGLLKLICPTAPTPRTRCASAWSTRWKRAGA